jgi:hypothetical protein
MTLLGGVTASDILFNFLFNFRGTSGNVFQTLGGGFYTKLMWREPRCRRKIYSIPNGQQSDT